MRRARVATWQDSKVTAGTDNHQRVTPKPRDCQPTPNKENNMTNQERAADLIADATIPPGTSIARGVDRAVLATKLLADAGLLMPDLPAPMQRWEAERTGGTPESRWYGYEDDGNDDGSEMYNPHRYIDSYPGEVWLDGHVLLSPEDARAYALAILAAANHAEKGESNA